MYIHVPVGTVSKPHLTRSKQTYVYRMKALFLFLSSLRRRGPPKESSETKSEAGSGEAMTAKAGADKDVGDGEGQDLDYHASESEGEDESTIAEQEAHEGAIDYHREVSTLEKEGMELPYLKPSHSEDTLHTVHLSRRTFPGGATEAVQPAAALCHP